MNNSMDGLAILTRRRLASVALVGAVLGCVLGVAQPLAQSPLTPLMSLRGRTDSAGNLLVASQVYTPPDGPLTPLSAIRGRTDANGYLMVVSSVLAGGSWTGQLTMPTTADCAAPSLSVTGDLDTGLTSTVANKIVICSGGREAFSVAALGTIIGPTATSPSNYQFGENVFVQKNGTAAQVFNLYATDDGLGNAALVFLDADDGVTGSLLRASGSGTFANRNLFLRSSGTGAVYLQGGAGGNTLGADDNAVAISTPTIISTTAASNLLLIEDNGTGDTTALFVDATGKLAIGAPPASTLNEQLEIWDATAPTFTFMRNDAGVTSGELLGGIQFADQDSAQVGEYSARIQGAASETHTNSARGGRLLFWTTPNTTDVDVLRLTIGQDGGVYLGAVGTVGDTWNVGTPTVGNVGANSCGTTAATIAGKNIAGKVTVGATAGTACRVTFSKAWVAAPACTVTNETTANLVRATSTTTTVDLAGTMVAGDVLAYQCVGY